MPPYKEKPIERRYWPVSLAAKEIGVAASTLYFWEDVFELTPNRSSQNARGRPDRAQPERQYTRADMEIFKAIKKERHDEGRTLRGTMKKLFPDLYNRKGKEKYLGQKPKR